jgi:hypothetical protein
LFDGWFDGWGVWLYDVDKDKGSLEEVPERFTKERRTIANLH